MNDNVTMNRKNFSERYTVQGVWLSAILIICCALLFSAGCTAPQQTGVKINDTVRVYYTGSFLDGTVFQSINETTPLEFTVGTGEVIAGFDEAVIGMTPGMTKTVTISPDNGYGPIRPELVNILDTDQINERLIELQALGNFQIVNFPGIGDVVLWQDQGEIQYLRFSNVTAETTTVDENHPLAGKDLIFKITVIDIVENKP